MQQDYQDLGQNGNYSKYMRVEPGRMKPQCLQLVAHLVEVLDYPPPPAYAWTTGVITDMLYPILPDNGEVAVAGGGWP